VTAQSGTVTLLFTDLVNSTELLSRTGDESGQRIFDAHHKLLSDIVAANDGAEVKWLGDGLMVAFPSAADAVRSAIAMQESAQAAAGERLRLRVGLHVGEAIKKESDYFGTSVVIARRLCERADAGQILCSSLVAGLLAGRQSFSFHDLGEMALKRLSRPVAACEVLYQHDNSDIAAEAKHEASVPSTRSSTARRRTRAAGAGALLLVAIIAGIATWRWFVPGSAGPPVATPAGVRSIAVLPLENLSGDPTQEYFADGMTDELITDLAKISGLRVTSRTSVMKFKGEHRERLPEIAKALDVNTIVEGSVLRVGDKVRITAQLIDAPADKHLWAESYERDARDVLALQDEVALAIARKIDVELTPNEKAGLAGARPVNPQAYEAYLKGRYFLNNPTPERWQQAKAQFEQAIKVDPNFALPYTGMADLYIYADDAVAPAEVMPKAKAAAEKALQLDDTLAEAHTALGEVMFWYDYDWAGAERELRRAIELNPSYALAHDRYGWLLLIEVRWDESLAEMTRANELDPLSAEITNDVAFPLIHQRKYEAAKEQSRKALELDPSQVLAQFALGLADVEASKFNEAIPELEKAAPHSLAFLSSAYLGYAYAAAGERGKAEAIIADLNQTASHQYVSPFCTAIIYLGLGNHEPALDGLEKAYEVRSQFLQVLKGDRMFDPLRSDRRFIALLKKVGLDK
jgi:adenylate cyclase